MLLNISEAIVEIEHVILYRIAPITPTMVAWSAEEVDTKLHNIMINIHKASVEAAEECGLGYNLVAGANIAGFKKVADAMLAQGIV